jgi:hypothetical protein
VNVFVTYMGTIRTFGLCQPRFTMKLSRISMRSAISHTYSVKLNSMAEEIFYFRCGSDAPFKSN